jgi:hypothetical protein
VRVRGFRRSQDGFGKEAIIEFDDASAAKMALRFTNLVIDNTVVHIEALSKSHPTPPKSSYFINLAQSAHASQSKPVAQPCRACVRVVRACD